MGDRKERGWHQENNGGTFNKKYSQTASKRTQGTYTMRGRDISVHSTLRKLARNKTLGSGNILRIVDIPEETLQDCTDRVKDREPQLSNEAAQNKGIVEATNEWLAANTVDFFNEVALLYGIVEEFHQKSSDQQAHALLKEEYKDYKPRFPDFSSGFPPGFQYRLKASGKITGAEYVNLSMIWLEDQIDNTQIFPETEDDHFPPKFVDQYVAEMFKRMFRIFAIMYAVCWPVVVANKADAHVNTCFKHFYFFMQRFQLLKKNEDRQVFTKTKVKNIMDLDELDAEYKKCSDEITKGK